MNAPSLIAADGGVAFALTPPRLALAALLLFLFVAAALMLAAYVLRWLERRLNQLQRQRLAAAPLLQRHAAGRALSALLRREPREWLALLMAAALLFATALLFMELLDEVMEREALVQADHQVFTALQSLRGDELDRLMVAITELGSIWITVPLGLLVFAWLGWQRLWPLAWYWVGVFVCARLSIAILKWTLERERPLNIYRGLESFSFPSGHATTSAMVYGFLAFLLARGLRRRWRPPLLAAAAVLVALIGLSRIYLGVHWFSDVIAGFALGLAWITLLAAAVIHFHPRAPLRTAPLAGAALLVIVIAGALLHQWHLPQMLEHYREAVPASVSPG
jgi:undecaprenyl-diphosphatase